MLAFTVTRFGRDPSPHPLGAAVNARRSRGGIGAWITNRIGPRGSCGSIGSKNTRPGLIPR